MGGAAQWTVDGAAQCDGIGAVAISGTGTGSVTRCGVRPRCERYQRERRD